jgi:hypothetical protein
LSLNEDREALVDAIKEGISIVAAGAPIAELGETIEALCTEFQALGICHLLIDLDVAKYYGHLINSAFCRRFFLRKSAEKTNNDDLHLAISRVESVLDAVAAGAHDLARDIVGQSVGTWTPDGEYEDDFSYFAFIHELVARAWQPGRANLDAILKQYQRALGGRSDPRYDLCQAAASGDAEALWIAFDALLLSQQVRVRAAPPSDDPWHEPRRHVFVEGLGWLEIARQLGFASPEADYALCPSVARPTASPRLPPDVFLELEQQFNL